MLAEAIKRIPRLSRYDSIEFITETVETTSILHPSKGDQYRIVGYSARIKYSDVAPVDVGLGEDLQFDYNGAIMQGRVSSTEENMGTSGSFESGVIWLQECVRVEDAE